MANFQKQLSAPTSRVTPLQPAGPNYGVALALNATARIAETVLDRQKQDQTAQASAELAQELNRIDTSFDKAAARADMSPADREAVDLYDSKMTAIKARAEQTGNFSDYRRQQHKALQDVARKYGFEHSSDLMKQIDQHSKFSVVGQKLQSEETFAAEQAKQQRELQNMLAKGALEKGIAVMNPDGSVDIEASADADIRYSVQYSDVAKAKTLREASIATGKLLNNTYSPVYGRMLGGLDSVDPVQKPLLLQQIREKASADKAMRVSEARATAVAMGMAPKEQEEYVKGVANYFDTFINRSDEGFEASAKVAKAFQTAFTEEVGRINPGAAAMIGIAENNPAIQAKIAGHVDNTLITGMVDTYKKVFNTAPNTDPDTIGSQVGANMISFFSVLTGEQNVSDVGTKELTTMVPVAKEINKKIGRNPAAADEESRDSWVKNQDVLIEAMNRTQTQESRAEGMKSFGPTWRRTYEQAKGWADQADSLVEKGRKVNEIARDFVRKTINISGDSVKYVGSSGLFIGRDKELVDSLNNAMETIYTTSSEVPELSGLTRREQGAIIAGGFSKDVDIEASLVKAREELEVLNAEPATAKSVQATSLRGQIADMEEQLMGEDEMSVKK